MFHGVRWFGYYGISHALLIVIFCQLLILLYQWILLQKKRCSKFLWASFNSEKKVVKMVTLSSIKAARSVLGDNYRYLSHKYSINFNDWLGSYNAINGRIHNFITQYVDCPQYAYIIRDLCYFRDYVDPFVLTSTEIVQLIEYVCTIYISRLISLGDIISYLYYKPVYYCVSSCAEITCIIALLCMIIYRIRLLLLLSHDLSFFINDASWVFAERMLLNRWVLFFKANHSKQFGGL